jgi:hypothetical protein
MTGSTRRNFLIATGAAGVAAAVTTSAQAAPARQPAAPVSAPADAEPMVAHISDPRSGVISLLVGDREVVVTDHDLVGRITRAAKEA